MQKLCLCVYVYARDVKKNWLWQYKCSNDRHSSVLIRGSSYRFQCSSFSSFLVNVVVLNCIHHFMLFVGWQEGYPACKTYHHNSVPGSPRSHDGIKLSPSQEHCRPSVLWCCWLSSRKGVRPVKVLPQQFPRVYLQGSHVSWKVLDFSWIFQAPKSPGNESLRSWKVLENEDPG